jgi:APA family basic amino acid/polyamine antiporter
MNAPSLHTPTDEQPRVLGGLTAFSVVAGSMLGVGIFLFPGEMAREIGSAPVFLALWLVGGIVSLAGATACGELGAMMPRAGGDYVYQRAAFGPSLAFASGWVLFAAVFAGSTASLSVALFRYQIAGLAGADLSAPIASAIPLSGDQACAVGFIVLVTLLNDRGARLSGRVQTLLTLVPITAIIALALAAGFSARGVDAVTPNATAVASAPLTLAALASGYLFVNFAFSGWPNIIYVAGEVRDPGRNVPRSMIAAVLVVTAMYLLFCAVAIGVLGLNALAQLAGERTDTGTALAGAAFGPAARTAVLVTMAMVIATSVNATVLASARVGYAMARDGAFWRAAARLNDRGVPRRALWLQAAFAVLFVTTGTFQTIVRATSAAMLLTGALTVSSLFVLRRRTPDAARPYRAAGHPWFPALYVAFSIAAIAAMLSSADDALIPAVGLAILLVAYAAHRLARRQRSRIPKEP